MLALDRVMPDHDLYKNSHMMHVYIDEFKTKLLLDHDRLLLDNFKELLQEALFIESGGIFRTLDRSSVIGFLKEFYGVKSEDLVDGETENSLAQDVVDRLINKGVAADFLALFKEWASIKASYEKMLSMFEKAKPTSLKSNRGTRLRQVNYQLKVAVTGRVYSREENIQNISYRYLNVIAAPEGYLLMYTDFQQIEPRIQYYVLYRDPSLDESFIRSEDTYEFMFHVTNPQYIDDFTKELRNEFKAPFLSAVYGQHIKVTEEQLRPKELATNLHRWLENNHRRNEYIAKLNEKIDLNEPITVSTYFGYRMTVAPNSDKKSKTLRDLINYPVQGTAHEIVAHYSLKTLEASKNKNLDVQLLFSRHDEPVFLVKMDHLKEILKIVEDHSIVMIGDWKPMTCDAIFSTHYKDSEGKLEHAEITEDIIQKVSLAPKIQYFPIKDELRIDLNYEYFTLKNGDIISVLYARIENNHKIYACASKESIGVLTNRLMLKLAEDFKNYDMSIKSPLPLPTLTKDMTRFIDEGNSDCSILTKIGYSDDVDYQITRTVLSRLIKKNEALNYMTTLYDARDFGFSIIAVN